MEPINQNRTVGRDFNNCRFCPMYKNSCQGNAPDCLCLTCPRNLGQCLKVRYCRETESILDLTEAGDLMNEDDLQSQLESYFKRME